MNNEFVKVNEIIQLSNGGHVLYVYEDLDYYVNNAVSYIVSGIEENHHQLVIDSKERYFLIEEKLKQKLTLEQLSMVHYIDNLELYKMYGDFHTQSIIHHFQEIIDPFFNDDIPIRTWAHVDWRAQSEMNLKLKEFEARADCTVNEAGLVSVCAYQADSLTVSLHMILMRNHEYLMTDKELVRSNLYEHSKKSVIFPSLSVQSKLQSEMDLYKQKLDFVHVVSHEVRNPLTVIKAYCSIIMEQELALSDENVLRVRDIQDYVDIIDHEMNHIIQTEQMLSTDLLWKKEIIDPIPVIREVIEFMSIKARTQHQILEETLNIKESRHILANKIGLKLVLSNLLSNAIKYSDEQSVISFAVYTQHNTLTIKVKDQGIGMSHDQVNELFEKYGKVNPDKSGSGIGLYMVKKLVDQFNGNIYIDSQPDRGTDVTLELPLTI